VLRASSRNRERESQRERAREFEEVVLRRPPLLEVETMAIPPIEDNSEEDGGGGVHLGLGVREGKKARGIGGLGGGERVDEEAQMTGVLGGGEGVEEEVLEQVSRDSGGGGGGDEEDVHGAADSSGSKEEEEDADTRIFLFPPLALSLCCCPLLFEGWCGIFDQIIVGNVSPFCSKVGVGSSTKSL
jgi:hypothetical protein